MGCEPGNPEGHDARPRTYRLLVAIRWEGECELERIKETREESLARESYPSAEAAARPLREPLRAHAFAEPALQRTETRKPESFAPGFLS